MKKLIFVTILSAALFLTSCDERSLQKVDRFVRDVNNVAAGAEAVIESPAGHAIPPDYRLIGLLILQLINGGVITWEEWRNNNMKKTTKSIVRGIEKSDTNNPQLSQQDSIANVKDNIRSEMIAQGGHKFFVRADKIIDNLKLIE